MALSSVTQSSSAHKYAPVIDSHCGHFVSIFSIHWFTIIQETYSVLGIWVDGL